MKNLANCKPSEFLKQTNKIRKSVSKWLADTDILNIRQRMPDIPEGATDEEKKEAMNEQVKSNLNAMLDAMLDEHPDETLEVLALICFTDVEHFDDHTVEEYIQSLDELINNTVVLNFFTSLAQLGKKYT